MEGMLLIYLKADNSRLKRFFDFVRVGEFNKLIHYFIHYKKLIFESNVKNNVN